MKIQKITVLLSALIATTSISAQVPTDPQTQQFGINFYTNFESGSLDSVAMSSFAAVQLSEEGVTEIIVLDAFTKTDPDNPADPTIAPSSRWFNFLMTGVRGRHIQLNFQKTDPQRPFYSYDGVNYTRFNEEDIPKKGSIGRYFYHDSVYIAYFTPYTEEHLNAGIERWRANPDVQVTSAGYSEQGRDMPLLIVTNPDKPSRNKKKVYIHGRIHTSETPSSWHLDKLIDQLTSKEQYAQDLRDNVIFYILPFTNPDGVAGGLSRSNALGVNLEVNYNTSPEQTSQEVKNILTLLESITSDGRPIDLFLNMHSQVANNATYWVHTAEATSDDYHKDMMLFANLTTNDNPYFKSSDLSFSRGGSKYLEGWFWDNFQGRTKAVTFETPYTFYSKNREGEWVDMDNLNVLATNTMLAIGDYLQIPARDRIIIDAPSRGKRNVAKRDREHIYFGDDYLESTSKKGKGT